PAGHGARRTSCPGRATGHATQCGGVWDYPATPVAAAPDTLSGPRGRGSYLYSVAVAEPRRARRGIGVPRRAGRGLPDPHTLSGPGRRRPAGSGEASRYAATGEASGPDNRAVAFTAGGKLLAAGCGGGRLVLWDAATGKVLRAPVEHSGTVEGVTA